MPRRSRAGPKASGLKDIALSEDNSFGERMRAIDLLGELGNEAFEDLVQIASKGLTYSERMGALDMIEKIIRARR